MEGAVRVAVDVGGTFTDLQLLEEASGRTVAHKVPTTPDDPSVGLLAGLAEAGARFGFQPTQISALMHGTTIATNAVLQRRLPIGALITTAGFEDVLEIGRHVRKDIYSPVAEPRTLLIPRRRRFGVDERVNARGEITKPLNAQAIAAAAERVRASGAETVAVCLLHAYANPAHEQALAAALADLPVSLSSAVSPEIREYERTSTTVLNALLMPVVGGYLKRLQERLREAGIAAPVYLVQSNGGVATPQAAAERPASLLLSGPAGGARAAEVLGQRLAAPDLVAIDMGGTSFDVSIIGQGLARLVNEGEVDGCPVRLPMVDMRTIGAGGGSIARVDPTGRLLVGPDSAGAVPGPACYGRGGTEATVTDANLVLGRIDPAYFLGGAMRLDEEAARTAVRAGVAAPLGIALEAAAEGILQVATGRMAAAIKLSLFEKGLDPADFALLSFGGAGGLHAAEVAAELGAARVIFPRDPGTLSAAGMLHADIVHELARSHLAPVDDALAAPAAEMLASLRAEAADLLERDGVPPARRRFRLRLDLRYAGQAYDISVPVAVEYLDTAALREAAGRFHALHETQYAHSDRRAVPEFVTMRLAAVGLLDRPGEPAFAGDPAQAGPATRRVWLGGGWRQVTCRRRDGLAAGTELAGPALVEEAHSVIFVPAGWRLSVAAGGELVAAPAGADEAREAAA